MKKKAKRVLCLLLVMALLAAPGAVAASADGFTDIGGHWAADSIAYVVEAGLFTGTSETTFEPDAPMTRAMFVTAMGRYYESIFGALEERDDSFRDTRSGAWYAKYVRWAVDAGIVQGYGDNTFGPDDPLTREQGVKLLYEFTNALYVYIEAPDDAVLAGYSDAGELGSWAKAPAIWAVDNGILTGTTSTTLSPSAGMTRAQAAVILDRYTSTYAFSPTVFQGESTTDKDILVQAETSEAYPYYLIILENDGPVDALFFIHKDSLEGQRIGFGTISPGGRSVIGSNADTHVLDAGTAVAGYMRGADGYSVTGRYWGLSGTMPFVVDGGGTATVFQE